MYIVSLNLTWLLLHNNCSRFGRRWPVTLSCVAHAIFVSLLLINISKPSYFSVSLHPENNHRTIPKVSPNNHKTITKQAQNNQHTITKQSQTHNNCGTLTEHLQNTHSAEHLQHTCGTLTEHLQNTYRTPTEHSQNTYKTLTEHLQNPHRTPTNTYRTLTEHLQNTHI